MEEKQVHSLQAHAFQARRKAIRECFFHFGWVGCGQPTFRCDLDAVWQFALEGSANDGLRFAHPVGWRQVKQGDPSIDRGVHGGNTFFPGRFPPELADAAAA